MNEKTIQCLPKPSQHVPISLQQFPSYTMLKSMRKSKNRYFLHIFVSPGDAPGAITLDVVWMERQFNVCQTPRSMYRLSSTVFQLFEPQVQKIAVFTYCSPFFVSPGDAPATLTQNIASMERHSMLAKRLAACTYLSSLFPSYTMLKSMRKSKNRHFTTFLFPMWMPLAQSR